MEKVPLFAECETGKVEQALLAQLLASMQNHHYFVGEVSARDSAIDSGPLHKNVFIMRVEYEGCWYRGMHYQPAFSHPGARTNTTSTLQIRALPYPPLIGPSRLLWRKGRPPTTYSSSRQES